ncbi:hypothetical protein F2P47_16500 [Parvibaculum sedimenti]|uniref:Lipoprotein n=1 Tax=Parvibaculum sedimenti TaxID=2608632 RepID=A0A6N6VEE9_9HYPH|nr:hypothetical protein [Parvibaculum sedimenti]KAB7738609.1 hypothetical protein F2P47_16500 [Parvibaculum sedimenti]
MNKWLRISVVAVGAVSLASCANEKVAGPTQEQSVMAAQYAVRPSDGRAPMQGAEADKVYENYIDSIGKPLRSSNNEPSVRGQ